MQTLTKNCIRCDKGFAKIPNNSRSYWERKKFCSELCANTFNSEKSHQKLRGIKRPVEVVEKCLKTSFKKGHSPWNKNKPFEAIRGEKHHHWKGGITPINRAIRTSLEYKLWRKAVFERDDYRCVHCGIRGAKGVKVVLHADHIKPFSLFPEFRLAIDNGRTLCKECHIKTDTYGLKVMRT